MLINEVHLYEWIIKISLWVFFIILGWYILIGFFKGGTKMFVRAGFLGLSFLVSWLITLLVMLILNSTLEKLISSLLNQPVISELIEASPTLYSYVFAIAYALISPILFLPIFFITSLIMHIPAAFVNRSIRKITEDVDGKKEKDKKKYWLNKLFGVLGGMCCAIAVSSCVFMPFFGYVSLGDELYTDVTDKEIIKEDDVANILLDEFTQARKNGLIKFETAFTRPLFNGLTKIRVGNYSTTVRDEIDTFYGIYESALTLGDIDLNDYNSIDVDLINDVIDNVTSSPHIATILAELLSSASDKWSMRQTFLTINTYETFGEDVANILNVLLEDFKESTGETVNADMKELTLTFSTLTAVMDSMTSLDFSDTSTLDYDKLEENIAIIEESRKLKQVFAVIMSEGGKKWANNDTYLSISLGQNVPSDLHGAMNVVFTELSDTSEETVCDDLRSFIGSIKVLNEIAEVFNTVDFNDYESLDVDSLDEVIDLIETDELVTKVVAVVLNEAGAAWNDNPPREYLGINLKDSLPDGHKDALDANLRAFTVSTERTAVKDLRNFSGTVKAYKYIINLADPDATDDQLNEDMNNFVNSVREDNVDILKESITHSMLEDANINPNDSAVMKDILSATLDNLSKLDDSYKPQEAEALNTLLKYSKEGNASVTDEEAVDAIMQSKAVSQAVRDFDKYGTGTFTATDAEKVAISNALAKYDDSTDPEIIATAQAIRKLYAMN